MTSFIKAAINRLNPDMTSPTFKNIAKLLIPQQTSLMNNIYGNGGWRTGRWTKAKASAITLRNASHSRLRLTQVPQQIIKHYMSTHGANGEFKTRVQKEVKKVKTSTTKSLYNKKKSIEKKGKLLLKNKANLESRTFEFD
eukprot:86155_1